MFKDAKDIKDELAQARIKIAELELALEQKNRIIEAMKRGIRAFCLIWIKCWRLAYHNRDWRNIQEAKKLWFAHCEEALPKNVGSELDEFLDVEKDFDKSQPKT